MQATKQRAVTYPLMQASKMHATKQVVDVGFGAVSTKPGFIEPGWGGTATKHVLIHGFLCVQKTLAALGILITFMTCGSCIC